MNLLTPAGRIFETPPEVRANLERIDSILEPRARSLRRAVPLWRLHAGGCLLRAGRDTDRHLWACPSDPGAGPNLSAPTLPSPISAGGAQIGAGRGAGASAIRHAAPNAPCFRPCRPWGAAPRCRHRKTRIALFGLPVTHLAEIGRARVRLLATRFCRDKTVADAEAWPVLHADLAIRKRLGLKPLTMFDDVHV